MAVFIPKIVYPQSLRPRDEQYVIYYFEPFGKWFTGTYDAESDTVSGKNGFTTWVSEVTKWMDGEQ